MGVVRALATYRVGAKIVSTLGETIAKMTIWNAVPGGQRSLTKRRPKRLPLPSLPTRPLMERPRARSFDSRDGETRPGSDRLHAV